MSLLWKKKKKTSKSTYKAQKRNPNFGSLTMPPPCIAKCSALAYPGFCMMLVRIVSDRFCEDCGLQTQYSPFLKDMQAHFLSFRKAYPPSSGDVVRLRVQLLNRT